MSVALVVILGLLTQADGCGRRYSSIECVSFLPDGSRLAVSRLDARNANTPLKLYKANVSRTISLLDASDGTPARLLHQDFERGNQGPAFRLWRFNRTSVACISEDSVAAQKFGGGPVTVYSTGDNQAPRTLKSLDHPAVNIAASGDGAFLAASGWHETSVIDLHTDTVIRRQQMPDISFLGASLLSFSLDNRRIAIANQPGVQIWELNRLDEKPSTFTLPLEEQVNGISLLPDGSVILAAASGLRQYDPSGEVVRVFSGVLGYYACRVSGDGTTIAATTGSRVELYDLSTGNLLRRLRPGFTTCMAFSPDGTHLAVGGGNGLVKLLDTSSGNIVWNEKAEGRYRLPSTVPLIALVLWFCCFVVMLCRRSEASDTQVTPATPPTA